MNRTIAQRYIRLLVGAAATIALIGGGCSDDSDTADSATTTTAPESDGTPFSTTVFGTPLDLVVPSFFDPEPAEQTAGFVSFSSPDDSIALRILRPASVFEPGATTESAVPDDYVTYLLDQADAGVDLTDREDTTVDGHDATLVTGTTEEPMDGSIGCPESGTAADACFGFQPDVSLRLAVVTTDDGPLLIWVRSAIDAADDIAAAPDRLNAVLAGLRFADRPVEEAATDVESDYDGTYTFTITQEQALASGIPDFPPPDDDHLVFPNTFTITLDDGRFELTETATTDVEEGPFEASPGHLVLHLGGSAFTFEADVVQDPDGTLHLSSASEDNDPIDVFILSSQPWSPA